MRVARAKATPHTWEASCVGKPFGSLVDVCAKTNSARTKKSRHARTLRSHHRSDSVEPTHDQARMVVHGSVRYTFDTAQCGFAVQFFYEKGTSSYPPIDRDNNNLTPGSFTVRQFSKSSQLTHRRGKLCHTTLRSLQTKNQGPPTTNRLGPEGVGPRARQASSSLIAKLVPRTTGYDSTPTNMASETQYWCSVYN